jgi:ectoine hydroxylase
MVLTESQIREYEQSGLLLLPEHFSPEETRLLKTEFAAAAGRATEARVLEADGRTVRSLYGCHTESRLFRRLCALPRLLNIARQLLGNDVYVHQFKINVKNAFSGDLWAWHQDYTYWLHEDGMARPDVVNVDLFLDDVFEHNGPIYYIPGSHRHGVLGVKPQQELQEVYRDQPAWISNLTSRLKYTLAESTVTELVASGGIVAPKGPAGTVVIHHGNIAHCSPPNLSPHDRTLLILTYNSVANTLPPAENPRPEFLASRNFEPLECAPGDRLGTD